MLAPEFCVDGLLFDLADIGLGKISPFLEEKRHGRERKRGDASSFYSVSHDETRMRDRAFGLEWITLHNTRIPQLPTSRQSECKPYSLGQFYQSTLTFPALLD